MDKTNIESIISVDSFDSVCRLCLRGLEDCKVFNVDDCLFANHEEATEELVIKDILSRCAFIEITEEDLLPKNLCKKCLDDLTFVYEFINKCKKSERILQTSLNFKKNEIECIKKVIDYNKTENVLCENALENKIKIEEEEEEDEEEYNISDEEIKVVITEENKHKVENNEDNESENETYPNIMEYKTDEDEIKIEEHDILSESEIKTEITSGNQECNMELDGAAQGPSVSLSEPFATNVNHSRHNGLKLHDQTHTKMKLYTCNVCGKIFNNSRHLIAHKAVHISISDVDNVMLQSIMPAEKKKRHTCDVCAKGFSRSNDLMKHKRIHTGEKPFQCDICKKCFSQQVSLTKHIRIHTGERPYKCDICESSFKESSHLNRHKERHMKGKRLYTCDICEKGFRESRHLDVHKRKHIGEKPYKCDLCGKTFQSNYLKVHMRTHTGEKPFKCDLCGKSFTENGCLTKHKRTHTGERPYKCDVCEKGFTESSCLKKHKKTHT